MSVQSQLRLEFYSEDDGYVHIVNFYHRPGGQEITAQTAYWRAVYWCYGWPLTNTKVIE